MQQLPKIVRQRLQAEKPDSHPDPDLLTAFSEKLLAGNEREMVLEHLSRCGDCREVLALALPQLEAQQVAYAPAATAWFRWPMLRWGALTACVVVVGAAVMLQLRSPLHHAQSVSMERSASPAPASSASAKATETDTLSASARAQNSQEPATLQPASPAQAKSLLAKKAPVSSKDENARQLNQSAPAAVAANLHAPTYAYSAAPLSDSKTTAAAGGKMPAQPAEEPSRAAAAAPAAANAPAPAASSGTVVVADNEAPIVGAGERDDSRQQLDKEAKVDADRNELAPGKAKQAASAGSVAKSAEAKSRMTTSLAGGFANTSARTVPRWTLASDGVLQRSFDAGKSWTTISVPTTNSLRAIAALGAEIWVGGSAGTLFHSADAGEHWSQVTPSTDGQTLSADIIGVEFTDRDHGKLTTADQHVWTTSDAGRSWTAK